MRLLEAIRRANRPGEPEHSIRLRVACTAAVLISLAAAVTEGEMSRAAGLLAAALIILGMAFSYRTRVSPPGWVKVAVAAAAVTILVWFVHQVGSGPVTDITNVENPLTVLFAGILAVHSFHVPARRDLMFSLGASAALMAVAAAQAIDLRFAVYALGWVVFNLWALVEMWASASRGGRVSVAGVGGAVVTVSILSALVFLLLPAPVVAVRVDFASRAGSGGPVGVPGALAGDGGQPAQLSKPGSKTGATRIGGYLGFAASLDTALRGSLSKTVVLRVRAERPSYWVGETFDQWDGQSWTTTSRSSRALAQSSPFVIPTPSSSASTQGSEDLQTFYVATATADLIFHAETATEVWFPTSPLYYSNDGTIVSPIGLGHGAIYTVESSVNEATPTELRHAAGQSLPADLLAQYTQLPNRYTRVASLAKAITAGSPDIYDSVESLIAWMGANTRYSTDIPPLPAGADTVNEFLFGDRVGFCEQISTSLAVMLRTLGIPARETVGYVPGPYDPIIDLYEVRADDAHAWVQVWFPGYGWQSFDPTAAVPLANPTPGSVAIKDVARWLSSLPYVPMSVGVVTAGALAVGVRMRRRRPATWAERLARRIERAGKRAGRPRQVGETLAEYTGTLGSPALSRIAEAAEASAYGGWSPAPAEQRQLLAEARKQRAAVGGREKRA